jgi:hypothetical protein
MAALLASAPVPGRADLYAATLGAGAPAEAALAAAALAMMDLSELSKKLLARYDPATPGEKRALLKVCESLADAPVFTALMHRLPAENDPATRAALQRALTRISQSLFTPPMFDATVAAYAQADPATRAYCLRFAILQGDTAAARLCQRAYADGLKTDALRTLGAWKNQTALDPLLALAKTAADERETLLAQTSLTAVMTRSGARPDALEYILKTAVRPEEKEAALKAAAAHPDKKTADWLAANGYPDQAQTVRENLAKKKK